MNNTKIIAIANQKGGVGKTTTTLSIGVALASLFTTQEERNNPKILEITELPAKLIKDFPKFLKIDRFRILVKL